MGYPVRLESALQHIHEGRTFTKIIGETLGTGASSILAFTTPESCCVHFRVQVQVAYATTIQYFKDATITGGTVVPGFNKNFNSSETHNSVITANPTISVVGTELMNVPYGAGNKSGGLLAWDEYVFTPDTTYYMIVTSGAASNSFAAKLNWVEDHN